MKIAAILLCRSGSKGIPNKNIADVNGQPLFVYALRSAQNARYISKVFLSSDSNWILSLASGHDAVPVKRPAELAQDDTPSEDAIRHFAGIVYADIYVMIQVTSPFVTPEVIDECVKVLLDHPETDAVFTGYKADNPEKIHYWLPLGDNVEPYFTKRLPRQALAEAYIENGAVYAIRKESLIDNYFKYNVRVVDVGIGNLMNVDIDTPEDLRLVSNIMRRHG